MPNTNTNFDMIKNIKEQLREIKPKLPNGAQRELARRLECLPDKVTNSFAGFIQDEIFNTELLNMAKQLLKEKWSKKQVIKLK